MHLFKHFSLALFGMAFSPQPEFCLRSFIKQKGHQDNFNFWNKEKSQKSGEYDSGLIAYEPWLLPERIHNVNIQNIKKYSDHPLDFWAVLFFRFRLVSSFQWCKYLHLQLKLTSYHQLWWALRKWEQNLHHPTCLRYYFWRKLSFAYKI